MNNIINKEMEVDLIKYCIRHMSSKPIVHQLLTKHRIQFRPGDSFEKLCERTVGEKITLEEVRETFRANWTRSPKEFHLENLKSGMLIGHDWHGTMPSMLHLGMQNKVRDCIDGKIALSDMITIGSDIMKHEYFMVATHDLMESHIIENFPDAIPPVGSKSISDFVLGEIPYDLKNTNYFNGHTKRSIQENKELVAMQLIAGADVERLREQAKKTINNWGLNRFYVLVEDQTRWIKNPEGILDELKEETENLTEPMIISIAGLYINVQLIAI